MDRAAGYGSRAADDVDANRIAADRAGIARYRRAGIGACLAIGIIDDNAGLGAADPVVAGYVSGDGRSVIDAAPVQLDACAKTGDRVAANVGRSSQIAHRLVVGIREQPPIVGHEYADAFAGVAGTTCRRAECVAADLDSRRIAEHPHAGIARGAADGVAGDADRAAGVANDDANVVGAAVQRDDVAADVRAGGRNHDLYAASSARAGRGKHIIEYLYCRAAAAGPLDRFYGRWRIGDSIAADRALCVEEDDAGSEHHVVDEAAGDRKAGALDAAEVRREQLNAAAEGVLDRNIVNGNIVVRAGCGIVIGDNAGAEVVISGNGAVSVAVDGYVTDRHASAAEEKAVGDRTGERAVYVSVGKSRTEDHVAAALAVEGHRLSDSDVRLIVLAVVDIDQP